MISRRKAVGFRAAEIACAVFLLGVMGLGLIIFGGEVNAYTVRRPKITASIQKYGKVLYGGMPSEVIRVEERKKCYLLGCASSAIYVLKVRDATIEALEGEIQPIL